MKVLNFGSLNIDHVYRVPHIVRPGETLSSTSFENFAGGKGANQSAALAKAGAEVFHAGKVGRDGTWLLEKLQGFGVNTQHTIVSDDPTGHAIIQVDDAGQNSIVLFAGANKRIARDEIDAVLSEFGSDSILLLQNEINDIAYIMKTAHAAGMRICLNPAPFDDSVHLYPLDLVDILVVNETEGAGLCERETPAEIAEGLARMMQKAEIIVTTGSEGAIYISSRAFIEVPGVKVEAVDTTAAGDTFIGYFLAAKIEEKDPEEALRYACKAAALCVSKNGAMDSIPTRGEVG